ncbi:response regulator [Alsobacter sp. SYSU M60028]|uniref:histidine kinase n=1 Tax=Alsobacter ponti TaxID=2962936 RepID=A0ABT1LBU9_9HYPH|nr:response regulator [Alsobacter ponti]MCP8938971.1 response regulator [Alsobacter ponti]
MSTRARLVMLVTAALMPAVLFIAWLAVRYTADEQGRHRAQALALSQQVSTAVDREIVALQAALEALATSPALQDGNLAAFDAQARRVLQFRGSFVAMRERSAQQVINTGLPFGTKLPVSRDPVVLGVDREVFATQRIVVSDLYVGAATGLKLVLIAAPVVIGGEVRYSLNIALDPARLADILIAQAPSPEWTVAIVDKRDRIVARNRLHERFLGSEATPSMRESTAKGDRGAWMGVTLEGTTTVSAFTRSPLTGWRIAVGVPQEVIDAPRRQLASILGAWAAAALALSILLAGFFARFVERPLERLTRAARELGEGDTVTPIATGLREADAVGDALADASALILRREEDLREAQRALHEANAALQRRVDERTADRDRLWRLSTDLMVVHRPDGVIVAANPAWTATLGWSEGELVGASLYDFFDPADAARTRERVDGMERPGGSDRFEARCRGRDGSWRWLAWTATEGNGLIHGVARDVTAEKIATEELERAQAALRQSQKMEAVGQLTGGIAHDFNNLLQAVSGQLELIRRQAGEATRVRRWADNGLQAVERGTRLTAQLLAFSRIQRLELRPVVVSELVGGMRDLLAQTLGPMIVIRADIAAPGVAVLADATQLELALLNLAINARDAMPEGGALTISTALCRVADDPELKPGDYLELRVADTGAGMTAEVAARAFDPFFTTKGVGKGTGLGLSQVYGLARQAGGTARIDTRPGRGTTVSLILPVAAQGAPAEPPPARTEPTSAEAGDGARVLVIDDDHDVRAWLVESLTELGYRPEEAEDGPSGLALLRKRRPDLVVLDFAMPGMTGAEVARIVRQEDATLPIILATGYADTAALSTVLGPGTILLRKPFGQSELAAAVRRMLDAAASQAAR